MQVLHEELIEQAKQDLVNKSRRQNLIIVFCESVATLQVLPNAKRVMAAVVANSSDQSKAIEEKKIWFT